MRIISFAAIRNYAKKHADADVPLRDWYKKTEKADWSCLADTKQTFNSVAFQTHSAAELDLACRPVITEIA